MTINMAVSTNKVASKNSMMILTLRSLTNFLIAAPNAAHGEIDTGQTSKATDAIISTDENKFISVDINPEAAMLEIVQAFGFMI